MSILTINKLSGKNGGLTINKIVLGPYDNKVLTSTTSSATDVDFGTLMSYDFFKEDGSNEQIIKNFTFFIENTSSSDVYISCTSSGPVGVATVKGNSSLVNITNNGSYGEVDLLYKRFFFPLQISSNIPTNLSILNGNSTIKKITSYNSAATSDSFDNNSLYKKIQINNILYNACESKKVANASENLVLEDKQFYIVSFKHIDTSITSGSNVVRSFTLGFLYDTSNFLTDSPMLDFGLMESQIRASIGIRKDKRLIIEMNGFSSTSPVEVSLYKIPLKINAVE